MPFIIEFREAPTKYRYVLLLVICGIALLILNMRVYNQYGIMSHLWRDYLMHSLPSLCCFIVAAACYVSLLSNKK